MSNLTEEKKPFRGKLQDVVKELGGDPQKTLKKVKTAIQIARKNKLDREDTISLIAGALYADEVKKQKASGESVDKVIEKINHASNVLYDLLAKEKARFSSKNRNKNDEGKRTQTVAEFSSNGTILEVGIDQKGLMVFTFRDKNDPSRKTFFVPSLNEMKAIRDALKSWKENQELSLVERFKEVSEVWKRATQGKNRRVYQYEKNGKKVWKSFSIVGFDDNRGKIKTVGFSIHVQVDDDQGEREKDVLLDFALQQEHFDELISILENHVNRAVERKRTKARAQTMQM